MSGCRRSSSRSSRSAISRSAPSSNSSAMSWRPPKYDVEECQQRGITFAAPLKVTLRLVVWDVDEDTGSRSIRDIKEQDVYMGDMPLMTKQRHLHHQRHRARHRLADAPQPRRVLRPRQGQDPFLGQVSVRRAGHPLSRLLARFRVRRQGPPLCPHRPAPQTAGDDLAAGARRRGDRREAGAAPGRDQDAAARRGDRHVEGGDPLRLLRHRRLSSAARRAG